MLRVALREAMADYRKRTAKNMDFEILARRVGMDSSSLFAIAKKGGSTTLRRVDKIAKALEMSAKDLLEEVPDEDEQPAPGPETSEFPKARDRKSSGEKSPARKRTKQT